MEKKLSSAMKIYLKKLSNSLKSILHEYSFNTPIKIIILNDKFIISQR